jgi:predicted nucleic-acid-binding protein
MTAVDTNVLVRFLVQDDPAQAARAAALMRGREIWVSKTVLLETAWVLGSLYGFPASRVAAALEGLAGLPEVLLEDQPAVARALRWFREGLDFADALHLASAGGARKFATFDRQLARRAKRLAGLETVAV